MTVAEWIKTWDSINNTKLSTKYYYKNSSIYKHDLYNIMEEIVSIKIIVSQEHMSNDNICVYSNIELNYNQQQIFNTLETEIPEGSFLYIINIYIN